MIKKGILLCVIGIVISLTSCSWYKDIVIGGLEPATPEQIEERKGIAASALEKEFNMNVNRDTIHVANGDKNGDWYAYAFTNKDRAMGILVDYVSKTNKMTVGLNKDVYNSRSELIDFMNEVRPDNELLNCYVDFFPLGFNTKWCQTEVGYPKLSYWVVIEGYDNILPDKRKDYLTEMIKTDYKIVKKATEIYKNNFPDRVESGLTLGVVSIKYVDKGDFDMNILKEKGDSLSDSFVTMDRSSVPNYIISSAYVYNRDEQPSKVIYEYELTIRGDQFVYMEYAPFMREEGLFIEEVRKQAIIK